MEMSGIIGILDYIWASVTSPDVTTVSGMLKLFVSLLLGGIVGFERKRKGQIAGVRTFALISMGATLAMLLSIYIPQEYLGVKNGDPGRIAAQVITGIGFLGAGAIIQMKGSVRGLTTAAGIWVIAAIGMAVGVGMILLAFLATFFIFLILVFFERYEHKVSIGWESKVIQVKINGIIVSADEYKELFREYRIQVSDIHLNLNYRDNVTVVNFVILSRGNTDYLKLFRSIHDLKNTISISLTNEISF